MKIWLCFLSLALCSHSIHTLLDGQALVQNGPDSSSKIVHSIRGTHNEILPKSNSLEKFSFSIDNQPRKLASESDYFKNVHEVIKEAASQYLLGKSKDESAYSANNPGWIVGTVTDKLFEAKFALNDKYTLFELKITFNGQVATCVFQNSEISDEMSIQYVIIDYDEMLMRIKFFVEDWTFRFLDKVDQTVVKIASLANDIQELINNEFAGGSNSLYGRVLSDKVQGTPRLNQISLSKDTVNENELKIAQSQLANFESQLQNALTRNSNDHQNMIGNEYSEEKIWQLKGNIQSTKIKIEQLQNELKKVKARNLKDENVIPSLRSTQNFKRQSNDSEFSSDSQFDLSFLERNENAFKKVQIFEEPIGGKDLVLALNSLARQRPIFSKGTDWLQSTFNQPTDRFLAFEENKILADPITGSPIEKVKAIVDRYKTNFPQTAGKNTDILYFNCDVGHKQGSETDHVHLIAIHIDDQVHVYAENSMFKFNYRISAITKRILIKNIEKILWDFRFLGYIARNFLEMEAHTTSIQSRKFSFDEGLNKLNYLRNSASKLKGLKPDQNGKDVFEIKFEEAVGTNKSPLLNSLVNSQRLTLNINTNGCNLKLAKDYPIFSMFNTWFMTEMSLKTLSGIFTRQFESLNESEENHTNIDMINPFLDFHENTEVKERSFSSFIFNRKYSFPSIKTIPILRSLRLPPGRILNKKTPAVTNKQTTQPTTQQTTVIKSTPQQTIDNKPSVQNNSGKSVQSGGDKSVTNPKASTKKARPYILKFNYLFYTLKLKFIPAKAPLEDQKVMMVADYKREARDKGRASDVIEGWRNAQKFKTDINRLNNRNNVIVV